MNPKNFPERKNIKRKLAWNRLISRFGEDISLCTFEENVEIIKYKLENKKGKLKKEHLVLFQHGNTDDKINKWLLNKAHNIATEIGSLATTISEDFLREKRTKIFRGQN